MTFGVLVRQPVPKRHLSSKIFLPVIKICNGGIPVLPVQGGAVS